MSLADIALLLVILAVAAGTGRRLSRFFGLPGRGSMPELCICAGLGLGALILLIFMLGIAGLLRWPFMTGLLALLAALSPMDILSVVREFISGVIRFFRTAPLEVRLLAFACAGLVMLMVPYSLAPPVSQDSLVYHLAAPKQYLMHGRIIFLPDNVRAAFPSGMGMLYALGLGLRGTSLAQLFHLAFLPLTALVLYSFGTRHAGRRAGAWASFIFCSLYNLSHLAPYAMTEMAYTFFIVTAFATVVDLQARRAVGAVVVPALFCGLSLTTRYQAAVMVCAIAVLLVIVSRRRHCGTAAIAGRLLVFGAVSLAVVSPWLVFNYVHTSNPVFPVMNTLFGDRVFHTGNGVVCIYGGALPIAPVDYALRVASFPWCLLLKGISGPPVSMIFPALLPGLVFLRPAPRAVSDAVWFAVITAFAFWVCRLTYIRFMMPAPVLLCLAAGYVVAESRNRLPRAVHFAVVMIAILHFLFAVGAYTTGQFSAFEKSRVALGLESHEQYLARVMPGYEVFPVLNSKAPQGSRVLLGPTLKKGFYIDHEYVIGHYIQQSYLDWPQIKSKDDLLGWMKSHGITHVLYADWFFGPMHCDKDNIEFLDNVCDAWTAVVNENTRRIAEDDGLIAGEVFYDD